MYNDPTDPVIRNQPSPPLVFGNLYKLSRNETGGGGAILCLHTFSISRHSISSELHCFMLHKSVISQSAGFPQDCLHKPWLEPDFL